MLFICLGIAEKASLVDMSDTETFLDLVVRLEGVDFGIVDGVPVDMDNECVDDAERIELANSSFGGTPGADGWPGSGFWFSRDGLLGGQSGATLSFSGMG